jgi:hypothetical protein
VAGAGGWAATTIIGAHPAWAAAAAVAVIVAGLQPATDRRVGAAMLIVAGAVWATVPDTEAAALVLAAVVPVAASLGSFPPPTTTAPIVVAVLEVWAAIAGSQSRPAAVLASLVVVASPAAIRWLPGWWGVAAVTAVALVGSRLINRTEPPVAATVAALAVVGLGVVLVSRRRGGGTPPSPPG